MKAIQNGNMYLWSAYSYYSDIVLMVY